ncbi:MAG: CDP-alcohol phosphatidyltransferase family protein [Nanoarchaeota archaeon]
MELRPAIKNDDGRIMTIPNIITLIRIFFVLSLPFFKDNKAFLVFGSVLFIIFDFEGALARRLHQVTALGANLDRLADLLFLLVSFAFFLIQDIISALALALIILSRIIRYASLKNPPTNTIAKIIYLISFFLILLYFSGLRSILLAPSIALLFLLELFFTYSKHRR